MTRKFKFLFLMIMLCGAVSSVFAQSIKPAEAGEIIAFYEWAFETKFTQAQRAKFQGFLQSDFRANAANARKDADTILSTWAQLKRASEDVREQARTEFLSSYLDDLRASSDADAKFLLGVYHGAHGGSSEDNSVPAVNNSSPGPGAADRRLTGKWWRSTGSGGNDDGTGKTRYNSGTMVTFEFFADGTVEYISDHKTLSITQCRIAELMKARGAYSVSGNSLKIDFGPTTTVRSNTCKAAENGKKTAPAAGITMKWQIREEDSPFRPDRPLKLCFDNNGGQGGEVCYEKDVPYRSAY